METVSVSSLNIASKKGVRILSNVNFVAKESEIHAIMGPSGCGKTTLLDLIANRLQSSLSYHGDIRVRGLFKYVPQEEHLHGFYTVRQYISHYLNLNYGFMDKTQKSQITESVIEATGLKASGDTRVGDVFLKGLSGGQKRRLSISLELVGKPDILILDEPTSGLDSVAAYYVMLLLKRLSSEGMTIVLTLHQPSSQVYEMLDKVTFLSGGENIFSGSTDQASRFFASVGKIPPPNFNPSDYFLFQINSDFDKDIRSADLSRAFTEWQRDNDPHVVNARQDETKRLFEARNDSSPIKALERVEERANFLSKFVFLTQRYLINMVMNPGIIFVRLVMYLILCFIIGFMYFRLGDYFTQSDIVSRASLLFYVNAFLVFMSIAVLPFFMIERGIIEKEIHNGLYSPIHYQVSMFITSLPAVGLIAIVSSLLVNLIADLNGFGFFFLILFLSLVCGESLALLISLVVPHYIIGMALVAGTYGVFMICEGFLIVRKDIPGYFIWIYYIGFHTYSFEGFMVNEFESIQQFTGTADFSDGKSVLKFYGMENAAVWKDVVILIGYALILQVFIATIMLFLFRKKEISKVEHKQIQVEPDNNRDVIGI